MSEGGFFGPGLPPPPPPPSQPTIIVQIDPYAGLLAAIVAAIADKLNKVIDVVNGLGNAIGAMAALQTATSRSVWAILRGLLSDVLHLHFIKALHDLTDLVQKIRSWAQKLKTWLDRYKQLRKQHDQAVRKLLNLMQRVRKILVPFRLLHLKFAQRLDAWLAGIEGRIITREHLIVGKTNEIIAWIDAITNPTGTLRGTSVLRGVLQFTDALHAAFVELGYDKVFPASRRITYGPPIVARPFADWEADFFKTAASSPSYKERFDAVVDAFYKGIKEEIGT
jgi:hypothetical protein